MFTWFEGGVPDALDEEWSSFADLFGDTVPAPDDFAVTLVTTPCQAVCNGDIKIDATGKATVSKGGKSHDVKLDRAALSTISGTIRRKDMFALKDEYGTGAPSTVLTVTMNGQTKKIRHNLGDLVARVGAKVPDGGIQVGDERQRLFDIESHIRSTVTMVDPEAEFSLPPALVKLLAKLDAGALFGRDASRD